MIVPLLLSTGYHLTTDLAGAARATGARLADPLGPDPLLVTALAGRLAEAGVPDGTPVVLAAAGSSDPAAEADAAEQAGLLAERLGRPGDGGVRVGGPALGAPRRWPSCGPAPASRSRWRPTCWPPATSMTSSGRRAPTG